MQGHCNFTYSYTSVLTPIWTINIAHINTYIEAFWSLEFIGACHLGHKSRICENFPSVPAFQEETDGKSNIIIDIIPMLCQYVIAFWMIPFTFITWIQNIIVWIVVGGLL